MIWRMVKKRAKTSLVEQCAQRQRDRYVCRSVRHDNIPFAIVMPFHLRLFHKIYKSYCFCLLPNSVSKLNISSLIGISDLVLNVDHIAQSKPT